MASQIVHHHEGTGDHSISHVENDPVSDQLKRIVPFAYISCERHRHEGQSIKLICPKAWLSLMSPEIDRIDSHSDNIGRY